MSKKTMKEKIKEKRKKIKNNAGSFFSEFKQFIAKGNIIDLSVAVVIGAAFNKIVSSLVNDVIMPIISLVVGGNSVEDWKWVIKEATYDELGNVVTAETALKYGVFIQTIIDFLIVAFTIFVILKVFLKSQKKFRELSNKMVKGIEKKIDEIENAGKTDGEVVSEENVAAEATNADLTVEEISEAEMAQTQEVQEAETQQNLQEKTNIEQTKLLKEIRDLLAKQNSNN